MTTLREILCNCSDGDTVVCTQVAPANYGYFTLNQHYKVYADSYGDLYIIDDDGDTLYDVDSLFVKLQPFQYSPSAPYSAIKPMAVTPGKPVPVGAVISGELDEVLNQCSGGDTITCVFSSTCYFTEGKQYKVIACDIAGALYIRDDDDDIVTVSDSLFKKEITTQPTESNATPKSVVDGDYSEHDTWGIGNKPHKKVKQWKPDTIREDIDIMESIRHACNRT